ncbi:translocation and assembly module TamA [Nitratiruptor sp. YY09-18]|nr:translocation and assembly module TamA [Nitratiruptor sp. YY09-18]
MILLLFCLYAFGASYYIDFLGNKSFSKERLYEELGFEPSLWQKVLHKKFKPKVDEKLLPSLQDELLLFYQEQGFLDAKIEVYLQKDMAIFKITENKPVKIADITLTSNFPLQIPFKKGERFVATKFIDLKKQVHDKLLRAGYCSYDFNPKAYVYQKSHVAYIAIYLDKGKKCYIGDITIKGLQTIPKKVIFSHLYIKPHEEFNLTKIDESYKRLYSLEFFDAVRFDYSKKLNNRVFIETFLKERRKHHVYRAGLGYETDQGAIASLSYRNLNFHAHQIGLTLRYSKIERIAEVKLFTPSFKILDIYADMRDKVGYNYDKYDSFTSRSYYIDHAFLFESYKRSFKVGFAAYRYKISDTQNCIESGHYRLIYPYIELLYDKRDSKIFPRHGYYLLLKAEASKNPLSDASYIKSESELGLFYPIGENILFAKAHVGFISTSSGLPPSKFFIAGGADTNRANAYRSLYALDSRCQIGGKSLLATTLEYRFPFKNLYGALFWDRTYLAKNYNLTNYVDGVGVGILYPSPVGTISAYFGIDPNNFSQSQLLLSIGANF